MRIKPPRGMPRVLFYRSGTFPSFTAPSPPLRAGRLMMPDSPLPPLNSTFLPIRPRLSKGPSAARGRGVHGWQEIAAKPRLSRALCWQARPRDAGSRHPGWGARVETTPPSSRGSPPACLSPPLCRKAAPGRSESQTPLPLTQPHQGQK